MNYLWAGATRLGLWARLFIYRRGVACVVLAVSVFVVPARPHAQQSAAVSELSNVLRDSDYALRRFEEVTSRINFNTWQNSAGEASAAQRMLRATLASAAEGKRDVAEWQSQGKISVSTLFELYDDLVYAEGASYSLSSGLEKPGDTHLATELIETASLLAKTSGKVRPYVVDSIRELEVSLGTCNKNQK